MPVIEKLKGYLRETILIRQNKNQCTGGRSLLCNNCTGGVILHELGLRFDTPTINTWIPDEDFLRFAENIAFYKKQQVKILPNQKDYVLACLGDVHVHFMHETDPEKAICDWNRRVSRLDEENLYCLFVADQNTADEIVQAVSQLPLPHVCVLTEKEYPSSFENVHRLPNKRAGIPGGALNYVGRFSLYKRYDVFDFSNWLREDFGGNSHNIHD